MPSTYAAALNADDYETPGGNSRSNRWEVARNASGGAAGVSWFSSQASSIWSDAAGSLGFSSEGFVVIGAV